MNGGSALWFIAAATLRNMLLRQARRVRQPRYLVASLFGLAYVANLVWRASARQGAPPGVFARAFGAGALAWVWMLLVLGGWLFGGDEGGLNFSDAEIQFLFPAPFTRRQLVSYKLLRSIALAFGSALLLSVTLGPRIAPNAFFFVLGAWLGLATLSLHLVAASLTRQSLLEHGVRGPARRALAWVIPAVILGALVAGVARSALPWPSRWTDLAPYLRALFETAPVSWAATPFAPAARVALASTGGELLPWAPAALGVLALHVLWALSTDAAFEQASVASAERRAQRVDRMRRGQSILRGNARPAFKLGSTGHPAVAIYWKNLTAAARVLSLRVVLVVFLPALIGVVAALFAGASFNRELGAIVCAVLAASAAFFGVQVYRLDFRFDLAKIDLLKSFPLRGIDIAVAQLLVPFTVLTVGEWVFTVAAAILSPPAMPLPIARVPFALTMMIGLPAISLPGLLVQNAAALLFPAWIETGATPPRGVEAIGQRLLTMMGTLAVVTVMLAPAVMVGAVAGALLHASIGDSAVPIGTLLGAAIVAAEARVGFGLLGRAFERFDPGHT